ncbi:hypothetical protein [Mycobacterium sp. SM1]|uniref:hypothetical protein n=1 Tax=Mycobacterium sp. SM1 TaxID=2816243 RepID=UPI001F2042C2|nr:hypothetical protein [Mycobacterium sp. SM1]
MVVTPELRPGILDVVGDRLHRPIHHRQHVPTPRRLAPLGLAVADIQHPVALELRSLRIPAEINQVKLRSFRAPQTPAVDDLEDRRVAIGSEGPFAFRPNSALDLIVGVVEEPLDLRTRERARLRAAPIIVQVRDRIPLVTDRHRMITRPELFLAHCNPAVTGVAEVLVEQPQFGLVVADRRRRQMRLGC